MRGAPLLLALLIACGHGAAPPPASTPATGAAAPALQLPPDGGVVITTLDRDLDALAAKTAEMFDTLADAVAAGGDCAAITTRLRGLRGRFDEVIAAARKVEADGRGAELEQALTPHETRIRAALSRMTPGLEACSANPELSRVFDEITGS